MPKTTKADFNKFCEFASEWLETYGLKAWEVQFEHDDSPALGPTRAWFDRNRPISDRLAFIGLGRTWDLKTTDGNLKRAAFHEATHLLLAKLVSLAYGRCVRKEEIDDAEHEIIRTLENVLFDEDE